MSINDYMIEDGIDVIGSGKGWSIWHEAASGRWRFDVFNGDVQRCVPMAGDVTRLRANTANNRLWLDAYIEPCLVEPVLAMKNFIGDKWPAHG